MNKLLLTFILLLTATVAAARQPNVIYILADDLGYGDVSAYGQSKFETPNIDALAERGMLFTQHYSGSDIGDLTAMALRDGKRWFVGILNGGQARDYKLALSFLPPGEYQATAVRDDPTANRINLVGRNPKADLKAYTTAMPFDVIKSQLIPSDSLSVSLATGGGYVLMLEPR